MFCKTIILSNSQNISSNAPKGILTLSKDNTYIKGKVRLYNLLKLPPNTKIGLYINDTVYTKPLTKKPNHYEFDLNENIDITQNIYCALIDMDNNKKVLLEGGSFNGFYFSDSPFDAVIENKDEELEKTIDQAVKSTENCPQCDCVNCEYKKYFYQHYRQDELLNSTASEKPVDQPLPINDVNPIEEFQDNVIQTLENEISQQVNSINLSSENGKTASLPQYDLSEKEKLEFLNDIIYQLDEMFTKHPADEMLNSIIPDSKFIRVEGETNYVLGVIYENKLMKYIAYGVPAQYNSLPPNDFGRHYQWLPLNPRDTMSDGYFMIYQDALTGSIVKIDFEE